MEVNRFITFFLLWLLSQEPNVSCDTPPTPDPVYDVITPFNFSLPRPANKFGIFTTIIVQMEFKSGEKTTLWRTNSAAIDDDTVSLFHQLCDTPISSTYSDDKDDYLNWGNCTFNDNQITAILEQGKREPWNKNFSYTVISTKPFLANRKGVKSVCILNEFPHRKAYVVLMTNTFEHGSNGVSEPIYKLDAFLPMALGFFEGIIDFNKILQFYPMDFVDQTKHYKCLIGILTGQDVDSLKLNCKFKCEPKKDVKRDPQRDEL
jgi:hypothetical protein